MTDFDCRIDDVDDEEVWTSLGTSTRPVHHQLVSFEKTLRCPICHEFYRSPVSLQCNHTFCSECVRLSIQQDKKSIKRVADCPQCRAVVKVAGADYDLRPNRAIEAVCRQFQALRENLKEVLAQLPEDTSEGVETGSGKALASATRRSSRYGHASSKDDDTDFFNLQSPTTPSVQRPKKPRTHYAGMKKKRLQELCAKEGLATYGSERDLIARHEAFVLLYNAECDSLHPRPLEQIIKQVHDREVVRRSQRPNANLETLYEQRARLGQAKPVVLTTGNHEFDSKLKQGFAKLIAQGRAQRKRASPTKNERKNEGEDKPSENSGDGSRDAVDHTAASTDETMQEDASIDVSGVSEKVVETPTGASMVCEKSSDTAAADPLLCGAIQTAAAGNPKVLNEISTSVSNFLVESTLPNEFAYEQVHTDAHTSKYARPSLAKKRRSLIGPWNCPKCTFFNEKYTWSRARCEMCSAPRDMGTTTGTC